MQQAEAEQIAQELHEVFKGMAVAATIAISGGSGANFDVHGGGMGDDMEVVFYVSGAQVVIDSSHGWTNLKAIFAVLHL